MNNLQSFLLFIRCAHGAQRPSASIGADTRTTAQSINIRTDSWQQEGEEEDEVAARTRRKRTGFAHRSFRLRSLNRLISLLWGLIWSGNGTQDGGVGVPPSGSVVEASVRGNLLHVDVETRSC